MQCNKLAFFGGLVQFLCEDRIDLSGVARRGRCGGSRADRRSRCVRRACRNCGVLGAALPGTHVLATRVRRLVPDAMAGRQGHDLDVHAAHAASGRIAQPGDGRERHRTQDRSRRLIKPALFRRTTETGVVHDAGRPHGLAVVTLLVVDAGRTRNHRANVIGVRTIDESLPYSVEPQSDPAGGI